MDLNREKYMLKKREADDMGGWLDRIKSLKKDQILIILLSGVLLLVIAMPSQEKEAANGGTSQTEIQSGTVILSQAGEQQALESRLQELLSHVSGVGKTQVMITLKSDGKKIVEKDKEQSQDRQENGAGNEASSSVSAQSSESTVYQKDGSGNETPYVTEHQSPEISGVLVVAQGGGNMSVVQEITEAVMALFGVEAHKIKVMKME